MTKAFIYVFPWWRKGKEKWCTESESHRCGFCRCGCMHFFLLADLKSKGWILPMGPNSLPSNAREGRQDVSIFRPVTRREKLRSVHHLRSSPLTPWNTLYCQHICSSGITRFEMSCISWLDKTKWSWTPERIVHGQGLRASRLQAQAPAEVFTAQIFNRATLAS